MTTAAAPGAARRLFCYFAVAYALFVSIMSTNAPAPLYALYSQKWHLSPLTITAVFAVYAVALLGSLLLLGGISDVVGRKPVLLASLLLNVGSAALFAGAHSVGWLYAARAVQGLSTGLLTAAATAALVELEPRNDQRKASVINSAALMSGSALGPLVFGLLAQYVGAPLVLPFVVELVMVAAAFAGLLWLPAFTRVRIESPARRRAGRIALALRSFVQRPRLPEQGLRVFALACGTLAATWSIGSFWAALTSLVTADLLHNHSHALAGEVLFVYFGLAGAVQAFTRNWTNNRAMLVGVPAVAVGILLLELAIATRSTPALGAAILCGGLGAGVSYMGSLAAVVEAAPAGHRAAVVAAYNVTGYIAVTASVISVGLLATHIGLRTATTYFVALTVAASALLTYALARRPRQGEQLTREDVDVAVALPDVSAPPVG